MRILMVGDVIGQPGRRALRHLLPDLRRELEIDLVIANVENSAGGLGVTSTTAKEIIGAGVDIMTSGNHVWDQKEIIPFLDGEMPILRPLNYPGAVPGRGYLIRNGIMVVNLIGRVFMGYFDCPFKAMDNLLDGLQATPAVIIVDVHAEATSEKIAMGWYLDGRVSAVLGTHTHVGTVDARLLLRGTAFVSDVGMVGPLNSVIGDETQAVIDRFLTQIHRRLQVGNGPVLFNSVLIDVDETTGMARSIQRIDRQFD